jgi:ATP-dependent Lon protease
MLPKTQNDIFILLEKKINVFYEIIQKTILYVQKNKMLDILGLSDLNTCINNLCETCKQLNDLGNKLDNDNKTNKTNFESIINDLQHINNNLSGNFKLFGTENLEDLLLICFGNNNIYNGISGLDKSKYELIKKYFHPTSYKIVVCKKENEKNVKVNSDEIILDEKSQNLECSEISVTCKSFHLKVYGIQIVFHNVNQKKSIIVTGIIDDVIIETLNNQFIHDKMKQINNNIPSEIVDHKKYFDRFLSSLSLKDLLILSSSDIYSKFIGYNTNINVIRIKTMTQITKDFISGDILYKRILLIQLLLFHDKYENQYLAYLLYDILSNDNNGNIDTQEQTILFDSFPWVIKQYFKDAMKKTIQYTTDLINFDIQKVPIEQQICLMKASDIVKEKAMQKLKEVKSKSDDSGSKARQYLDGLLKLPFSVFRKEPILYTMKNIKDDFLNLLQKHNIDYICNKSYTNLELSNLLKNIKKNIFSETEIQRLKKHFLNGEKKYLQTIIMKIEKLIHKYGIKYDCEKIVVNNKKEFLKNYIIKFIDTININININNHQEILYELMSTSAQNLYQDVCHIERKYKTINVFMNESLKTLDNAVHGHVKAKKQISRILGQWINGEQDGYCFGFEGPPGVGKTSLAKRGLSNCLKDEHGESRPFAMIQIGGDSNGSSLHGHNYTYVGSTWGSIAQILMDKKCMNPIIFIDEIDKISRTEHGKEIIGILTHLLDPTQNDSFQDKYFTGIDLDLSKALFILSYNDVSLIDRVLLDRIHRIKFSNLTLEDKLTICNSHILPELLDKMGLTGMIHFNKDVLTVLIDEYTLEPGVRKLKEILFEIIGEINLDILNNYENDYPYPIEVTIHDLKYKYFKEKNTIVPKKVIEDNRVGFINGLWANAMGHGGVIPIQCNYFPSEYFLNIKLTGMQGDVMKESMNVALTLAWNLTSQKIKEQIMKEHKILLDGIHIHCPEGSTPKDGPSAGTAITTTIYSLFNNLKINYSFAITGEISLDGYVSEIGGLDLKFLGGIKAGITEFIFPKENIKDFENFMEKYKDNEVLNGIHFHMVEKIEEVFKLIFIE